MLGYCLGGPGVFCAIGISLKNGAAEQFVSILGNDSREVDLRRCAEPLLVKLRRIYLSKIGHRGMLLLIW